MPVGKFTELPDTLEFDVSVADGNKVRFFAGVTGLLLREDHDVAAVNSERSFEASGEADGRRIDVRYRLVTGTAQVVAGG